MNRQRPSPRVPTAAVRPRRWVTRPWFAVMVAVCAVAGAVSWWQVAARSDATRAPAVQLAVGSADAGFAERALRDEQIRVWHIALDADTGSAIVLGQLAALHFQRAREGGGWDDYLTAEAFARHSLDRRTNRNGAAAVTLVNALLAQHRFTEARDVATALVQRETDIPEYRALLGEVALELGDDAVADAMFRSVWEQRSQLSLAPRVARWLELTNHVREARQVLEGACRDIVRRRSTASETRAWFSLRLGDLELRAGNLRRAERAYREGLRAEPGDPRLFAALARVAMARDEPRVAVAWGERAISLQLDPATLGLVGDAYAAVGDSVRSAQYFQTLEVAVSAQPGAYHRAWSLYLLDHGLRVDTVLAKARAELAERRDVYGYDLVAWALYRAGRFTEASVMMQHALRLGTPDPLLQTHARLIAAATHPHVASR